MKAKPYKEYKPSGVGWIGDVPEHWDVKRLKFVASINDDVLSEDTDPEYEIEYVDIGSVKAQEGIRATEKLVFESAPSRARRQVKNGDTIVSTVRTYLRAIAPIVNPPNNLIVSTGFAVVRPRAVEPAFFSFSLQERSFIESVVSRSVGVSYPATNASEIGDIAVVIPSVAEQHAIAAYLERATGKIDAVLAKKRELIERLKEKRTALISALVTGRRGIDGKPYKAYKPSGVDWLGDVPEHWNVKRLRFLTPRVTVGIVVEPSKYYVYEGVPCLRSLNVNPRQIIESDLVYISNESNELHAKSKIYKGDLVAVRSGQPGTTAVVSDNFHGANCIDLIIIRKPYPTISAEYLSYYLNSDIAKLQFSMGTDGAIQQHFNITTATNLLIIAPPTQEQQTILSYLDRETSKLDALIGRVETAMEHLREYRTALISAVVTGKIDVRNEVKA